MNNTYKIHYKCLNCGTKSGTPEQMIEIQKGQRVSDTECPNCGCKNLLTNAS
ncbi:MAG: hypothetical protein U0354_21015 [Candidatus Sericytochromatia bacterium]